MATAPPLPPPTLPGRNLILCFDGTAGQYDGYASGPRPFTRLSNTNAVKLFALLKKDDFRQQLCYYQPGIGTYVNPSMVSPIFEWGAKVLDEAFAMCVRPELHHSTRSPSDSYLNGHVMDGYRFLMDNYHSGDKICLFGFSRGSYTARALAGMLYKGNNQEQVPFAFKMYKDTSTTGVKMAAGYKQTFCQNVHVEFMGVWDTVDSVGVVMSRTLPFSANNSSIKILRHAVSLDEHRVRYLPYLCEPKPSSTSLKAGAEDVLEVWFAGCHSDIGGGAVADGVARSLSDITLRWMVRQAMASECDIQFDNEALARAQISPTSSIEPSPSELSFDDTDSGEPLEDELSGASPWWLLEIIPMPWSVQDAQGVWHRKFGFHLGKGRVIPDAQPKFHHTVKERMANAALKYTPKAQWTKGNEVYVE
ncbi:hypothetical protein DFH07DRAFT_982833 [Mycena maculata]|uniref:T6SS Phospholipase effector Tle1-like catalytic domain-containing protein n=1 Tax=Mycena maculata TaxID=230809 RepID=A0AAD7ICW9_9AGAR|nr:hypothetical protein DFH07DRAFT_982833 [Mycena maculata]